MTAFSRRTLIAGAAAMAAAPAMAQERPSRDQILRTMKRATRFMTDRVAHRGGYVWSYLPDFSRRWGELEALPTMIWMQPPGTGTMGHLYLDAYHATGDEQFYRAAEQVGAALVAAQHRAGGWNYVYDFAGERSLRRWYATYAANAWRMEEFHHYTGNATFDDAGTAEAMQFLLRLHLEKGDRRWRSPLDRAISFVLDSQYPMGGWPQRWPNPVGYDAHVTFNDDVAGENIKFLLMVKQTLGDPRVEPAIRRAMDSFLATQQPAPQAAWGLQHTLGDLRPAAARTYEPRAFATHTTASNVELLFTFYELTGDRKYLRRIPEALAWLESTRLAEPRSDGRTHPTYIEVGSNRPLYVHRRGSNVISGRYYADHSPDRTLAHYSGFRRVDLAALRRRYEELAAVSPAQASAASPLLAQERRPLPRFFANRAMGVSDLNLHSQFQGGGRGNQSGQLVASLNREGWWPTPLRSASNPYVGPGPRTPTPGDYSQTHVGDRYDTSPYPTENPVTGISVGAYIQNMGALIDALQAA